MNMHQIATKFLPCLLRSRIKIVSAWACTSKRGLKKDPEFLLKVKTGGEM